MRQIGSIPPPERETDLVIIYDVINFLKFIEASFNPEVLPEGEKFKLNSLVAYPQKLIFKFRSFKGYACEAFSKKFGDVSFDQGDGGEGFSGSQGMEVKFELPDDG